MASSSGVVPHVSPSQVLSVSPSLPTNKLLDNLNVKRFPLNKNLFFLTKDFFRKTKDFYNLYLKIMNINNILPLFIKLY